MPTTVLDTPGISRDAIASVYGCDWATVQGREKFFERLGEIVSPEFEWRAERPPAPKSLSYRALQVYTEAIENDFREFVYLAHAVEEDGDGIVVKATLEAVGRLSHEPFDPEVTHLWVPTGDGARSVHLIES